MIVVDALLHVATLDARVEGVGRVGRYFLAEQIEREGIVQVQFFLDRRQVDHTQITDLVDVVWIGDVVLRHRLQRGLDRTTHAGFAHEHVVRFFGQHEAAGAR